MFTTQLDLSVVARKPCIYALRLIGTGRFYVGQTTCLRKRIGEHRTCARVRPRSSPKLYNAIRKYGEEAFELTVLAFADACHLCELELYYIRSLKAVEDGFNICLHPTQSFLGRHHTEEHKARMSALKKGVPRPPHVAEAVKKALTGKTQTLEHRIKNSQGARGIPKTEETKAKMRAAAQRRYANSKKAQRRASGVKCHRKPMSQEAIARRTETRKIYWRSISQFDTRTGALIAVHPSVTLAAKAINGCTANICCNLKGRTQMAYGYVWKYTDECTQHPTPQPITLNN